MASMSNREAAIKARAHEIWEREGRPDGREQAHWEQATKEIDAMQSVPTSSGIPPDNEEEDGGEAIETLQKRNTRQRKNGVRNSRPA